MKVITRQAGHGKRLRVAEDTAEVSIAPEGVSGQLDISQLPDGTLLVKVSDGPLRLQFENTTSGTS
jgi:hypothetical protein